LPVELEVGCELEPKLDPEGEEEPDAVDPPTDEPPPAVEEPPPAVDAPLDAVLLEWPPAPHEEEEEEEEEEPDEEADNDEEERSRVGGFPAGTASESTYTSPRMCSTNCAGTPDWFTGWVNTTCTPVAVTVSALAPEFAPPPIGSNGLGAAVVSVWLVEVVVVPAPVPVLLHEVVGGNVPVWSQPLGVVVVVSV
jgi:hypothetical protein